MRGKQSFRLSLLLLLGATPVLAQDSVTPPPQQSSRTETELRQASRAMFSDTRNLAEGAAAAPLAAALQERARLAGKRVALVQSGGNVDRALFAEVLRETEAE